MSRYTLTFIEEPTRRGDRLTSNSIDLSPLVTDQFTGHMMGAISGRSTWHLTVGNVNVGVEV